METGSNGEVVREYDYDVYGGLLGMVGGTGSTGLDQYNSEGTRYLYTNQEFDSESNLYYYNARYYNPSTGRFLSRDPILGQPGNVLSNNPYIYVQNNPLKYVDPSGMIFVDPLSITLGPSILASNIVKKTAKDVSDKAVSLAIDTYNAAKAQSVTPKASINKSTSKNVGNPSGSTSAFKQIADKAYEDAKKLISTVLNYNQNSPEVISRRELAPDSIIFRDGYVYEPYDGEGLTGEILRSLEISLNRALYYAEGLYYNDPDENLGLNEVITSGAETIGLSLGSGILTGVVERTLGKVAGVALYGKKGVAVIGPRATYQEYAKKIGAKYLDLGGEPWSWAKNKAFLADVVKSGDDVIFAGKFDPSRLVKGTPLDQEINYLLEHGYKWSKDLTMLIK